MRPERAQSSVVHVRCMSKYKMWATYAVMSCICRADGAKASEEREGRTDSVKNAKNCYRKE